MCVTCVVQNAKKCDLCRTTKNTLKASSGAGYSDFRGKISYYILLAQYIASASATLRRLQPTKYTPILSVQYLR